VVSIVWVQTKTRIFHAQGPQTQCSLNFGLAVLFLGVFMSAKHDPMLRGMIPFGRTPMTLLAHSVFWLECLSRPDFGGPCISPV
jgi:hypothetical protein